MKHVTLTGAVVGCLVAGALVGVTSADAARLKPARPGDFNGDGRVDLAIGAVHRAVDGQNGAGAVVVRLRGATGPAQVITQASPGVPGPVGADHAFGGALVEADFNVDGFSDLAIGAPDDAVNGHPAAGSVTIVYGGASGLRLATARRFTQATAGLAGPLGTANSFGASVASGDLNGDGYPDLAVGAPFEDVNGVGSAGSVTILYGGPTGVSVQHSRHLTQATAGVPSSPHANGYFGAALAAGDTNRDGYDELAVGAPEAAPPGSPARGLVLLFPGTAAGPRAVSGRVLASATSQALGWSLAVGDFNGDRYADVAAGAPNSAAGNVARAGAVLVYNGSATGVRGNASRRITADTPGVPRVPHAREGFGQAVAAGDVDGDGLAELAIGLPGATVGGLPDAGAVVLLRGNSHGLGGGGGQALTLAKPSQNGFFGLQVALTNVRGDAHRDLLAAAPGRDCGSTPACGMVQVVPGSASGLTGQGGATLDMTTTQAGGVGPNDEFGIGLPA